MSSSPSSKNEDYLNFINNFGQDDDNSSSDNEINFKNFINKKKRKKNNNDNSKKKKTKFINPNVPEIYDYDIKISEELKSQLRSFKDVKLGTRIINALNEMKFVINNIEYNLIDLIRSPLHLSIQEHYLVDENPFDDKDLPKHSEEIRKVFLSIGVSTDEYNDHILSYAFLDKDDKRRDELESKNYISISVGESKQYNNRNGDFKKIEDFKKRKNDKENLEFRKEVTLLQYTENLSSATQKKKDIPEILKNWKDVLEKYQLTDLHNNMIYRKIDMFNNTFNSKKYEDTEKQLNDYKLIYFLNHVIKPVNILLKKEANIVDSIDLIKLEDCNKVINNDKITRINICKNDNNSDDVPLINNESYETLFNLWVEAGIAKSNPVGVTSTRENIMKKFNQFLKNHNITEITSGCNFYKEISSEYLEESGKGKLMVKKSLME